MAKLTCRRGKPVAIFSLLDVTEQRERLYAVRPDGRVVWKNVIKGAVWHESREFPKASQELLDKLSKITHSRLTWIHGGPAAIAALIKPPSRREAYDAMAEKLLAD